MKEPKKTNDLPVYTISIAAKLMGVSVHTLRMYERECLIIPYRTETNRRLYSDSDVDRIKNIRDNINKSKLSINSIRMMSSLIPCWLQKKCSEKDKRNCKAFSELNKPYCAYKHKNNICGHLECRECDVYKFNTDIEKVFESIVSSFVDGKELQKYY